MTNICNDQYDMRAAMSPSNTFYSSPGRKEPWALSSTSKTNALTATLRPTVANEPGDSPTQLPKLSFRHANDILRDWRTSGLQPSPVRNLKTDVAVSVCVCLCVSTRSTLRNFFVFASAIVANHFVAANLRQRRVTVRRTRKVFDAAVIHATEHRRRPPLRSERSERNASRARSLSSHWRGPSSVTVTRWLLRHIPWRWRTVALRAIGNGSILCYCNLYRWLDRVQSRRLWGPTHRRT